LKGIWEIQQGNTYLPEEIDKVISALATAQTGNREVFNLRHLQKIILALKAMPKI